MKKEHGGERNDRIELEGTIFSIKFAQHPRYIFLMQLTNGKTVTVVGSFPTRLFEGFRVKGTFRKETHERFGLQYLPVRVSVSDESGDNYRNGVVNLLSKNLHGVGPKTAAALVEYFDRRVFSALDEPDELAKVPGINERRASAISDAWKQVRDGLEELLPLFEVGLSPAQIQRIIDFFGTKKAVKLLYEDVYSLMRAPGIGFRTVDRAAISSLGYSPSDERRLRAAVTHILWVALGYGDTAPTLKQVEDIARRQLDLKQEALYTGLEQAVATNLIVFESQRYSLPHVLAVERDLYATLEYHKNSPIKRIRDFEPPAGSNLSPAQSEIFRIVATQPISYITGLPGTGKTYTVGQLAQALRRHGLRVLGLAPTGKAALRMRLNSHMEAYTVHKALGAIPESAQWSAQGDYAPNTITHDVVIVDESSMLDIYMLRAILRSIEPGRTRLVLVGDPNQLPPIGPGEPFAQLLDHLPGIRLKEVFRQAADNPIISAAHAIANGRRPQRRHDDNRLLISMHDENALTLDHVIREYSRFWELAEARPQILVPGNRGPLGVFSLNRRIKALVNPCGDCPTITIGADIGVNVGDPVIVTRNNYKKGVMNGEQGIVLAIEDDGGGTPTRMLVDIAGQNVVFDEPGEFSQMLPAYAISVHRSQGSQWPAVMTVLTTSHYTLLNKESLYTALTRAEKRALIIGSHKALNVAVTKRASQRSTWLPLLISGEVAA